MTSRDLVLRVDAITKVLNEDNYLIDALSGLSRTSQQVREIQFKEIDFTDNPRIIEGHKETRQHINEAIQECKQLRPSSVFVELHLIDEALDVFVAELQPQQSRTLGQMKHQIEQFAASYEHFIRTYEFSSCLSFLVRADTLHAAARATIDMLTVVRNRLLIPVDVGRHPEKILSLFIPGDDSFKAFAGRLDAVSIIHGEVCALLKVSQKQRHLAVVKIESGSAWLELLGEPKVLRIMSSMIVSVAGYLYRKHTVEGKRAEIPKKVDVIESVLGLRDDLEERGIQTGEMDEELKKSSVIIAKQMTKLLAGADEVEVNGHVHPIAMVSRQKLLRARTPAMLQSGAEIAEPEDPGDKE